MKGTSSDLLGRGRAEPQPLPAPAAPPRRRSRAAGNATPSSALVWIFIAFLALDYLRPQALQALRLQMVFVIVLPLLWLVSGRRVWTTNLTLQACFFVTGAMMLPFARNNYEVLLNTRVMLAFLVTAIATVWLMGSCRKYFYRVEWGFVAIMSVQAVYAITHLGRGYGEFLGDENDLALACNMVFPFGFVGFQMLRGRVRWIWGLVAVLMLTATVVSFSRGGFVGMTVAAAYCVFMSRHRVRNFAVAGVAALVLFLVVPASYKGEIASIEDTETGTAETRLFMWVTATRIWLDYPIFGVGPYNAKYRVGEYQPDFEIGDLFEATADPPQELERRAIHSLYFELLAERGLVGVGLFAAIAILHFRTLRGIRRAALGGLLPPNRRQDALFLALALEASMAGFLAAGAFLSMATYPHFWFLSAQGSALERWLKSERTQRSPSREPTARVARGAALAGIALCAASLLRCGAAQAAPPERRSRRAREGLPLRGGARLRRGGGRRPLLRSAGLDEQGVHAGRHAAPPWLPVFLRLGGEGVVPGKPGGAPALPAGATAKHVLREQGSGGADSIMTLLANDGSGGSLDVTDKTLCVRGYVSYSEDHPVPGNIKIARAGTGRGLAWQANWGGNQFTSDDRSGVRNPPMVSFISDFQGDGKPDVDCKSGEPRECLAAHLRALPLALVPLRDLRGSHPRAAAAGARALDAGRGRRLAAPGSGAHGLCVPVPTVAHLAVNEQIMMMDLHGEQLAGSEQLGARYLSHALITLTPYDTSFWPGPARGARGPVSPRSRLRRVTGIRTRPWPGTSIP